MAHGKVRSACLSGRKKYREGGEAGPASCSHELVKQLICLWNCSCGVRRRYYVWKILCWGLSLQDEKGVSGKDALYHRGVSSQRPKKGFVVESVKEELN